MESNSYSSYPDSGDSSPHSREIYCESASWNDAAASNYKVKFMCSYGGKIQPRPHDNQLAYVGGDTKILAVERNIPFLSISSKLSSFCDAQVCFKYQLPGEDLDALISVTNDEDLEHMMLEYDRLQRGSIKPARLRLFLFPLNIKGNANANGFAPADSKPDRQWFMDALNSAPIQSIESALPANSTDFLFGLEKGYAAPAVVPANFPDHQPKLAVTDVEAPGGSDLGKEERSIGSAELSPAEIQKQIEDLQRMHIVNQEHAATALFQRRSDESLARAVPCDYYPQNAPEKTTLAPPPVSVPTGYWTERQFPAGDFTAVSAPEHPVYFVQTPAGVYSGVRPVTAQVGQGYYAMQRMVPDVYRDAPPIYGTGMPAVTKVAGYPGEGAGRPAGMVPGATLTDMSYGQVAYDSSGRQVYYAGVAEGGVVPTAYQTMTASVVDARQTELKAVKPAQVS